LRISPDSVTATPMTTRKTTYSASHGRSSTIAPTMTRRTTGAASEGRSRTMTDDRGRTPSNANLAVFASDALRRGCLPPAAPAAAGRRRRFPFCEFRLGANDGARTFGANDHAAAGAGTARHEQRGRRAQHPDRQIRSTAIRATPLEPPGPRCALLADIADFIFADSGSGRTMERSAANGEVGGAGRAQEVRGLRQQIAKSAALTLAPLTDLISLSRARGRSGGRALRWPDRRAKTRERVPCRGGFSKFVSENGQATTSYRVVLSWQIWFR
jgi:hypothetical protein